MLKFVVAAVGWGVIVGSASAGERAAALRVVQDATTVSVFAGERLLMEYRYTEVPFKPYVKQLCSPSGVNVLRDAPHDHLHHHALMFAVSVDGVDFWAETAACGREVNRSLEGTRSSSRNGHSVVEVTEEIDWIKPDKTALLREHRTLRLHPSGDPAASLLTWKSRLEPAQGKDSATLGGSHYFGLGLRFVESMDKGGRFFNAAGKEGEVVRGDERLVPAKWCAYTASVGDKNVTVVVFDHPNNPRHPARMFSMATPFAYLSATLNLWKEPLVVKAGQPLELRYGVAVCDGEVAAVQIERLYKEWLALVDAR